MLSVKKDFPILNKELEGKGIVYLDSAATSQKPQQVIDSISDYYSSSNANVHRGIHTLSDIATELYEDSRKTVADFIGATVPQEIVFTKNATESLNRVAFEWGFENLVEGDEMIAIEADHHSNLVPWQVVSERTGAKLTVLPVTETGELDMVLFKKSLSEKVKFIAISHASNVLGTIFPVKEVCKLAKEVGAVVSVDGAQAVPHMQVNVQKLGCDFYSFSGHKMLGPMGIGVLWAKREILENMPPYEYGGGMIDEVKANTATYASVPERFEAGTPNVSGAVGLAEAIKYLEGIGMSEVEEHEKTLVTYALEKLSGIENLKILGPLDSSKRTGLVAFNIEGIHSHDLAAFLSEQGIAVRSGQHCTMPLHDSLGISSSVRASFYVYNSKEDIDYLVSSLKEAKELLS
ncbi:cysteine desulfurase [candidate division WWE3 bacterium]|jgi:cysteine desulfurase / selenocysteine lyase|nr:cysteine desulfurase [candidate division WWE3 bacterium]MBT7350236.1 cysteine desulfurase [candidate division WWE3 bacterium]